jgi:ferrochelatase
MAQRKTKILIGQLGSPQSPAVSHVRSFLKEFLGDRRVVDLPRWYWKIILTCFVLPFRPRQSAKAYARIWKDGHFPLIENTHRFTAALAPHLEPNLEIESFFLLSSPRLETRLENWEAANPRTRAEKVIVLPQFPQYSEATIASVYDCLGQSLQARVNIPHIEVVAYYHKLKAFIDNSARQIEASLATIRQNGGQEADALILSFHGMPLKRILEKKDEYYLQCFETFTLLKQHLNFPGDKIHFTFQSRFGSEQWLGPSTAEHALKLAAEGKKNIACYCPSFVVDCLETTDEIGHELKEEIEKIGKSEKSEKSENHIRLHFIPCLNDDAAWVKDYAHYINTLAHGTQADLEKLFYTCDENIREQLPEQKYLSPPLEKKSKKYLKLVFLTLFLDLIGFSIIFPMFPSIAKYYLQHDSENFILQSFFKLLESFSHWQSGTLSTGIGTIVLFGGVLGALYSLLQFFASPFWGSLSDRVGRRPIMLISLGGLFLSYALWFFSGSFTLLLLSRLLGGLMAGNMSVATAIVADVTSKENRSRGMAFVGIAFALGFVFGPAIGGILSMIDLTKLYPDLVQYGVNPFSVPALFAAVLSLVNFILVALFFEETLKTSTSSSSATTFTPNQKTANIFKLAKKLPFPGVNQTNLAYFLFITIFSGMEFTLTFLAFERLGYTPLKNAYMFIFIGFVLAFIQGGYVRRKAHEVGEKKMATRGLITIIPGLLILSIAHSNTLLYLGLFFLAMGSAMCIPTLTTMVSLLTPVGEQGRVLGVFRSLGALGRVCGPILASTCYWSYGSVVPYVMSSLAVLIPVAILKQVKHIK